MTEEPLQLESSRVLWVAPLVIAVSVAAVLAVREVAVQALHPDPRFQPLTLEPPIVDTVACTVVAIFVFIKIGFCQNPARTWRRLATVVLIVSLIPDVLLVGPRAIEATWPEASALMLMHVVVWAICITLLPWLAFTKNPRRARAPERPLSIL